MVRLCPTGSNLILAIKFTSKCGIFSVCFFGWLRGEEGGMCFHFVFFVCGFCCWFCLFSNSSVWHTKIYRTRNLNLISNSLCPMTRTDHSLPVRKDSYLLTDIADTKPYNETAGNAAEIRCPLRHLLPLRQTHPWKLRGVFDDKGAIHPFHFLVVKSNDMSSFKNTSSLYLDCTLFF